MKTVRVTIDLSETIADLREAARYCRSNWGVAVTMTGELTAKIVSAALVVEPATAKNLKRLADNLSAGATLVVACPDLLRSYLLGAAEEIEAMALSQAREVAA